MTGDDTTNTDDEWTTPTDDSTPETRSTRDRLEAEASKAFEQIDESIIDLLAWLLDTETRARIYIQLRNSPDQTSEEIASGTGLYPSTVREALAKLHDDGIVAREKRKNSGAGNNPFQYTAIAPSALVMDIASDVQDELNTIVNLDRYLEGSNTEDNEPIRIEVHDDDEESG